MGGPISRSGGGIVFGGSAGTSSGNNTSIGRALRRRWASGVAIVLVSDRESGLRGITATSLMVVSEEPPIAAVAVVAEGEFAGFLEVGTAITVSILESEHEFIAERFAGRAPLPDRKLTGIRTEVVDGLPVIASALGWARGTISSIQPAGDHLLALVDLDAGGVGPDTDDPLMHYEGRYRRLEAG